MVNSLSTAAAITPILTIAVSGRVPPIPSRSAGLAVLSSPAVSTIATTCLQKDFLVPGDFPYQSCMRALANDLYGAGFIWGICNPDANV